MKKLTLNELQIVSGGIAWGPAIGNFLAGALVSDFLYNPAKKAIVKAYTNENTKMVNAFKRNPSTLTNRFSFNGDF